MRPKSTSQVQVRASHTALALFYRQISVMFNAGVPLTEALRLASYSEDRHLSGAGMMVGELLRSGYSMSRAMKTFPAMFDPVEVGLIAAAESSGRLAGVLSRLADSHEKRDKLRKTVVAALTYPALLLLATVVMSVLFFATIFPINQEVVESMQIEVSSFHRFLAGVVDWASSPWAPVLLLAMGGGVALGARSADVRERVRVRVLGWLLLIPAVRQLQAKARGLRMLEVLSLLLDSGGTVDKGLKFMLEATRDPLERAGVKQIRDRLIEGEELADAIKSSGLFPPLVVALLEVGQETGRLPDMARRGARMCEEDVQLALETASSVLEPILLGIAGLAVGGAVITTAMPMLSLLRGL